VLRPSKSDGIVQMTIALPLEPHAKADTQGSYCGSMIPPICFFGYVHTCRMCSELFRRTQ
jgi:hypothetical protein